jgi:muconolactone D-isomerase
MEFLVQIEVSLPGDMPEQQRADLLAAERERGLELRRRGVIERIWRVPGGLRNVGIWQARDTTELHEAISALPLFPWLRAEVTALARHPLEASD